MEKCDFINFHVISMKGGWTISFLIFMLESIDQTIVKQRQLRLLKMEYFKLLNKSHSLQP